MLRALRGMSIGRKLAAMVVLPTAAALLLIGVAIALFETSASRYDDALLWSRDALAARELEAATLRLVRLGDSYVDGKLHDRRAVEEAMAAVTDRAQASTALAARFGEPEIAEEQEIGEQIARISASVARAIDLSDAGDQAAARALYESGVEDVFDAALTPLLERRVREEQEGSARAQATAGRRARRDLAIPFALATVLVGASFAVSTWIGRRFRAQVATLEEAAGRIGARDFSRPIPILGDDELARLAGAFNRMAAALAESTDRVSEAQKQLVLADRLAAVGQLAAGVAHEVNNPLSFVLANLNFAAEELPALVRDLTGTPPSPAALERHREIAKALDEAREGARRVAIIVRDLGGVAHGDGGSAAPVDLVAALERALRMAARPLDRIEVVRDLGEVPLVLATDTRLGQVFLNLLLNAGHAVHSVEGGEKRITVRTRTRGDGAAVVELEDTGPGIAPEIRRRLFDAFFTTKPVGVGTGLGLSVCHGIVSGLGGSIEVESEPGHGALFRVVLPAGTGTRAA